MICRVIILLAITLSGPASVHAYRTSADLPALSGAGVVRWPDNVIRYRVDLEGVRAVAYSAVERAVREGLSVWEQAGCADLTFQQVGSAGAPESGDGFNDIGFVAESWVAAGFPSEAVGATDVLYQEREDGSWQILEADVWLNAWDYEWDFDHDDIGGTLRRITPAVAHEAGHMLGLLHRYEPGDVVPPDDAIMSPFYSSSAELLGDDDLAGVCFLYPARTCGSCPAGTECVADRCTSLPCGGRCSPDRCIDSECRPEPCDDCSGAAFGEPCVDGDECESGLCLTSEDTGVCTLRCTDSCVEGRCQEVDGVDVCVLHSSAGCSASGGASSAGLLLLVGWSGLRRRR